LDDRRARGAVAASSGFAASAVAASATGAASPERIENALARLAMPPLQGLLSAERGSSQTPL